jgi:hypothetical protein
MPPADLRDVIAVDAGRDFSVALKSDGTVVAWGLSDRGQTAVPGGLKDVVAISTGETHTLALRADGTVVAWGFNDVGQCTIPSTLTGVVSIAAGDRHSLALKADKTVVAWGDNSQGQLNVPTSGVRGIAAGGYHSLTQGGSGPILTNNPMGRSVRAGTKVTFTAGATGDGLQYQWQLNGVDIAGATSSALVVDSVNPRQGGVYTVKVTDQNGVTTQTNASLVVRGRLKWAGMTRLPSGSMRVSFTDEFGAEITAPNSTRYEVQISDDLTGACWVRRRFPAENFRSTTAGLQAVRNVSTGSSKSNRSL